MGAPRDLFSHPPEILFLRINKKMKNIIVYILGFAILVSCSFDPRLEELRFNIRLKDESEFVEGRAGLLHAYHCCKLDINYGNSGIPGSYSPVSKALEIGEFRHQLAESFTVGSRIRFQLLCTKIDGLDENLVASPSQCGQSASFTGSMQLKAGELVVSTDPQTIYIP